MGSGLFILDPTIRKLQEATPQQARHLYLVGILTELAADSQQPDLKQAAQELSTMLQALAAKS